LQPTPPSPGVADEGVRLGARVTTALPRLLSRSLGPVLRRRAEGDPAFLGPRHRSHADAMSALPDEHWDRLIHRLDLVGLEAVLDIGCGSGDWLPALAQHNARVMGVDADDGMLELARARSAQVGNVELHRMPAESLELPDEAFDAVTCFTALPYLDQSPALREMGRVLRPGGRLIVGTVSSGYYLKHISEGLRQDDPEAVRYGLDPLLVSAGRALRGDRFAASSLRAWSPRAVRRLLRDQRFEVDRVRRDVDAADPSWPTSYLGWPVYLIAFATKPGAATTSS
jgi:SAM-dependent methyltransferase